MLQFYKKLYAKAEQSNSRVKRNELSIEMQSRIIWILSSAYSKTLWMCE